MNLDKIYDMLLKVSESSIAGKDIMMYRDDFIKLYKHEKGEVPKGGETIEVYGIRIKSN